MICGQQYVFAIVQPSALQAVNPIINYAPDAELPDARGIFKCCMPGKLYLFMCLYVYTYKFMKPPTEVAFKPFGNRR